MKNKVKKEEVYLGLGSNIGDRAWNINFALSFLQSSTYVDIVKISSFYDTYAIGPKQRRYYNIVIKALSEMSSKELLMMVKQVERIMGRRGGKRWGERIIDIDILFFGCEVREEEDLVIPHRGIEDRVFVMAGLNEIGGEYVHPVLKREIREIYNEMEGRDDVKVCRRIEV